jgi:toluene monooxygenase electron transfer component
VRLLERIDLTADMTEFVFCSDGAARFEAGQFALLSLPGVQGDRAYSMSNLPNSEGLWRFVVKRVVNGHGSSTLFALPLGSEVTLDGPYGLAYLRNDSPRDIICIAGGSGLSPVLAILAGAARSPEHPQRGLRLFYGGRRPDDICVPAVIERDPCLRGRVDCVAAVSDPLSTDAWDGERGFIHEVVQRRIASAVNPADHDYYFCGPPMMIDAVQRLLLDMRVPTSQVFYDRFV